MPIAGETRETSVAAPDGTRLYLRTRPGAPGPTIVLCDGIACDGFIWKYLWDDLPARSSVAHWNYRGHGRSGAPVDPDRVDVPAHVADLGAVRDALGDPDVVLVGHSFGTQIALEAYRARPEGIRALVLICGSFGRVTHTFRGTDLLANVLPSLIDWVEAHPRMARALWGNFPPRVALRAAMLTGDLDASRIDPADVEPYFVHAANLDFPMFLRMLRHAGEHSAQDLLASVRVPVLVVAGERDSFTPPTLSEAMVEALPDAELLLLPGGTHVTPLEHREVVRDRIARFLAGRGIPSPAPSA
ncbi:MAG: alpha/beta hydrolase [Polyangiaceae bacterium]|nr:alpha/beta hydrolase [Polyangiaceae bacterium]